MAFPQSGSSSTFSRSNQNLEVLIFVEEGKPENPEKNPRSKDENQQQTQPTCDAGSRNRTRDSWSLVGGERSHHCAIPAPRPFDSPEYFGLRSTMVRFWASQPCVFSSGTTTSANSLKTSKRPQTPWTKNKEGKQGKSVLFTAHYLEQTRKVLIQTHL